jgi:RNA polymerase sigma-70 factor (ECF subfamily)
MSNEMNRKPHMFRTDDRFLVEQVCQGDLDAFRVIVERYQKYAYQIAFRILRSHHDAEDASQEAFVRVYQSLRNFRHEAKFSTYLYRTVVNLSLNTLRRKSRENTSENSATDAEQRNSGEFAENPKIDLIDVGDHLQRAIQQLSKRQQAVLVLRHYEGMSTREVSEILKCSEGTVKQQLHRAMGKLQKLLHYMQD